jgi:hypothetical protein
MRPQVFSMRRLSCAALLTLIVGAISGFAHVSASHAACSADPWADVVVDSSWTAANAELVLGAPDLVTTDFEDEGGFPGFVIVAFGPDVIVDGPGDDLVVHVVDFTVSDWVEAFELWASPDGVDWVLLGVMHPVNPFGGEAEQLGFDLLGSGLETVTQVRVVNQTIDPQNLHEGVDLDAFEALNCAEPPGDAPNECHQELEACSTELHACGEELMDSLDALDRCLDAQDGALDELDRCGDDVAEAVAGLEEIERLLQLPPGRRTSSFRCSGETCDALMGAIGRLVAPPGQGVRAGARKR